MSHIMMMTTTLSSYKSPETQAATDMVDGTVCDIIKKRVKADRPRRRWGVRYHPQSTTFLITSA